ncbi:hypothetical protein, partial [Bradyrhizobium sp. STM 3809]|uniref:hypothetical protein n=1 Tax=Bradyrhizobium sp. STM 3809 TaxID=551936 RepID=UPI001AEBBC13
LSTRSPINAKVYIDEDVPPRRVVSIISADAAVRRSTSECSTYEHLATTIRIHLRSNTHSPRSLTRCSPLFCARRLPRISIAPRDATSPLACFDRATPVNSSAT